MNETPPAVCWYPGQWLGGLQEASNASWLKSHGIKRVITCAVEIKDKDLAKEECREIEWIHLDMEDNQNPSERGRIQDIMWYYLPEAIKHLNDSFERGLPTLLHCVQGWQRSPSVLVCFLVQRFGWEPVELIEQIRSFREGSFFRECHFKELILEWSRQQFFNLRKN